MTSGIKTIIYPVKDRAKAKAVYGALLGVPPAAAAPCYGDFAVAGQDIGLDPRGHTAGMTAYWHVDDIKSSMQALLDAGAELPQVVKDVGGGRLIASVKDPDGNISGLSQSA